MWFLIFAVAGILKGAIVLVLARPVMVLYRRLRYRFLARYSDERQGRARGVMLETLHGKGKV